MPCNDFIEHLFYYRCKPLFFGPYRADRKGKYRRVPNLFLIAGPNGAGKSTSAPELLSGARRVTEFVNADVIAKAHGVSEIQAGRITLNRLTALVAARQDMAFETTLASHLLLPRIRAMQASGYRFHLFFFWLPNAGYRSKASRRARRQRRSQHPRRRDSP
jgi:predicted ABC-type ATPase